MFNILFLTDFSENADTALQYAVDLVIDKNGLITIFNSYLDDQEEAILKKLKYYQIKFPDVKIDIILKKGNTLKNIKNICSENEFNLIVMGFKGESNIGKIHIGSVTSDVIRNVKENILAVPVNSSYTPIKRIAYALDYIDFNKDSLSDLNQFAQMLNAEIILLHVNEVENYFEEEKLNNYRKIMDAVIDYDNLSFEFIEGENVSKSIEEYIEKNEINVLAMLTRDYHLIKKAYKNSLTKRILFHTNKPLLVFHE